MRSYSPNIYDIKTFRRLRDLSFLTLNKLQFFISVKTHHLVGTVMSLQSSFFLHSMLEVPFRAQNRLGNLQIKLKMQPSNRFQNLAP